jgi:hypothetical protein
VKEESHASPFSLAWRRFCLSGSCVGQKAFSCANSRGSGRVDASSGVAPPVVALAVSFFAVPNQRSEFPQGPLRHQRAQPTKYSNGCAVGDDHLMIREGE